MPLNFALEQKAKVVSGAGTVSTIAEVIETAGYKKPFIVTDKGIIATGVVDKVTSAIEAAGIEYVLFDEVTPDPKDVMVEKAAVICKESECDCVIAVGGGAVIDTAKGVTVLRFNPGRILDYGRGAEMCYCPGLIGIPTTSGTGAEMSNGIIISDSETDEKVPIVGWNAMSEYVICDPEVTVGMPKNLTALTGLDSFAHAMEAYTTILTSPAIAPICEKVMEDVIEYLPRAIADGTDIEARERLHINASIGGWMLANACANVGHSLAHTIGGYLHIPHGAACAYAAPVTIKHIAPALPAKIKRVGMILGATFTGDETPEEIGKITAAAYENFRDNVVCLEPVSTYNIAVADAVALAPKIPVEAFAPLTPVPVTEEIAAAMLEEIFA